MIRQSNVLTVVIEHWPSSQANHRRLVGGRNFYLAKSMARLTSQLAITVRTPYKNIRQFKSVPIAIA